MGALRSGSICSRGVASEVWAFGSISLLVMPCCRGGRALLPSLSVRGLVVVMICIVPVVLLVGFVCIVPLLWLFRLFSVRSLVSLVFLVSWFVIDTSVGMVLL